MFPETASWGLNRGGLDVKLLLFLVYYAKLRLRLLFGLHRTFRPVGMGWRWRYWQDRRLQEYRKF